MNAAKSIYWPICKGVLNMPFLMLPPYKGIYSLRVTFAFLPVFFSMVLCTWCEPGGNGVSWRQLIRETTNERVWREGGEVFPQQGNKRESVCVCLPSCHREQGEGHITSPQGQRDPKNKKNMQELEGGKTKTSVQTVQLTYNFQYKDDKGLFQRHQYTVAIEFGQWKALRFAIWLYVCLSEGPVSVHQGDY